MKRVLFIMEIKEISAVADTINKSYVTQSPRKRWLGVLHVFGKLRTSLLSTYGLICKTHKNSSFSSFILCRFIKYRKNQLGIMAFVNDKSGRIYKQKYVALCTNSMVVPENEFRLQNEENEYNWISNKPEIAPLQTC